MKKKKPGTIKIRYRGVVSIGNFNDTINEIRYNTKNHPVSIIS
jgi:hypothetical protein